MNKYNLEITYKDICNVTRTETPSGEELIVELYDGSIIKAYRYEKRAFGMFGYQAKSCNEQYEALSKVVNDYFTYAYVLQSGHNKLQEALKEVEDKLEAN